MNTYKVINKIKSSKWNAFLLKQNEVDEYLEDNIPTPKDGLFSRFSKAKKENDLRIYKRMIELFSLRLTNNDKKWEEYFKNNVQKLDKEIISIIVEPTKNMFNRKASFVFKNVKKDYDNKLKELIDEGKKESGDIVAFYPVSVIQNKIKKGVLFITTKGICFISIEEGDTSTIAPYAVANALGGFGAIAVGVATIASKYVAHSVENYKMDKEQQAIIGLSDKYSPCLIAKCFEDSQFIPYHIINALTYGSNTRANKFGLSCFYQNIQKKIIFEVEQNIMIKIVEILSGNNPPKIS